MLKLLSLLRKPSMDEFHSYAIIIPSLSEPEPLNVISESNLAYKGAKDSIVEVGTELGLTTKIAVDHSDQSPSLSCTLKEII